MRSPRCRALFNDRLRERMLGFRLDGCGELEKHIERRGLPRRDIDDVSHARLPFVSVPVLSKATTFTVAVRSRWTPPLNKTPRRAAPPIAERMDAGVLMISAHGDATTITVIAR